MRLSKAEIVLLADHLDQDPSLLVGEVDQDEAKLLIEEGARSLVARGFCEIEAEGAQLSNDLLAFASGILTPVQILVYSVLNADGGQLATVLVGPGELQSMSPAGLGVFQFEEVTPQQVLRIIEEGRKPMGGDPRAYRLELLDGPTRQPIASLGWAQVQSGDLYIVEDDQPVLATASEVAASVASLFKNLQRGIVE